MALRHEIGRRIRRARDKLGINQGELAKRAGCTAVTLSHIETGKKPTNVDLVEAIAKVLGLEPWQLLTDRAAKHSLMDCIDTVSDLYERADPADALQILQDLNARRTKKP